MINVVYDHQIFSVQKYGGISRYFYELAKRVDNNEDFSARIVAPIHVNAYLKTGDIPLSGFFIENRPKIGHVIKILNHHLSPPIMRRYKPNICHETYFSMNTVAPGKCPLIVTIYDMIHEAVKDAFVSMDDTPKRKIRAVQRADHVLCISENTRRDLLNHIDIDERKVTVVHLGFSLMTHSTKNFSAKETRPFLLYVGQRGGYKNFKGLLSAYAASVQLCHEFKIVAFGGGDFTVSERRFMHQLGLNENHVQHVSGDDSILARLYQQARTFVYPSVYEGFGIPPLEAMNYGCPVACSNTSSMPEVVGDAAFLFDPEDINSMRETIEKASLSDSQRELVINKGYERIKLFSWDRCANETMEIYKALV